MDSEPTIAAFRTNMSAVWEDYAGLPPFRRGAAGEHGLTDADVRRLLRHGVIVRQAHGLLVGYRRVELAEEPPEVVALRVQAMQRRYPIGVAGFRTAAALHEQWLIGPVGPVHLLRVQGFPRQKHDVWVETTQLPPEHRCVVHGVVATSKARTAADLAQRLPGGEALALVDSALRQGVTTAEIMTVLDVLMVDPEAPVREVVALGDPRSGSALESLSRWLFHCSRLPKPELQAPFRDQAGPFAETDFYWEEYGVVGEADGMLKYNDPAALRLEKIRQERLERLDLTVVRWTFDDVTKNPFETVARVADALRRGRARRTGAA